jgi:hypothetical protein
MMALAPYALPGIILASALGALIVAMLLFRYGFGPYEDEEPEETERRLMTVRVGHGAAALCFASVAILAVAAWAGRPGERAAGPLVAGSSDVSQMERLTAEVQRLEERLDRELARVEERLAAATLPPATTPRGDVATPRETTPPRASPPARPAERPRASRAPARESETPTALPGDATARRMQATVQGVRVDVETRPDPGGEIVYTIRLLDAGNRALPGMDVSLHGSRADGSSLQAELEPAQPGVYRSRLGQSIGDTRDLRLRVVGQGRRFEVALNQAVSW